MCIFVSLFETTNMKTSNAVNIGRMTIAGLNFEADAEYERSEKKAVPPNVAVCAETEL